jgi:DNA-binding MarR family transcriptional regulator
MTKINISLADLVQRLDDGNMLSEPLVKFLVERAINTTDSRPLYEYLENYPIILTRAERNINMKMYQNLKCPFSKPTRDDSKEYLNGPLKFGYINQFDDKFGIPYDDLSLPLIIPGRVGSGKSQLVKYLLCQILRKKRSFNVIIPDLKAEYRNLLATTRNLRVLTKDHLFLNPLQVPDWMTPRENIIFFSKLFVSENYLAGTSQNVLLSSLEYIYKERGIYDGSRNWPTLHDLYNVITKNLSIQNSFKYRDIFLWLQNRLHPYVYANIFDYRRGIPFNTWQTENAVLEMDEGVTDNMYSFIVSYIAGLRYSLNKKKRLTGSKLRTLFIIDEGRLLFNAQRDVSIYGESYINEIATKTREFGVGYVISSQETSSFNKTIRAIAYTKICFPLTDGTDIDFIQNSFGLSEDQAEYVFKLPRFGQAIVRYGGYKNPFLLAVPQFNLKRQITDEEVKSRMSDFYADLARNIKRPSPSQPLPAQANIPPNSASLLYFLSKHPFAKISAMTGASGFKSPAEVSKALEWLEKAGFVRREKHRVSKRGRKSVFAVLTPKAYEYLGKKQIVGKGDFEHKLYQFLICRKLENDGLQAKIEGRISGFGKLIDVLARSKDGQYVAYEVTLHFENIISNIRQDLESGASKVFIVAREREGMQRAQKAVNANPEFGDHVEFVTIDQFFD